VSMRCCVTGAAEFEVWGRLKSWGCRCLGGAGGTVSGVLTGIHRYRQGLAHLSVHGIRFQPHDSYA
jgi:hypothetical protein